MPNERTNQEGESMKKLYLLSIIVILLFTGCGADVAIYFREVWKNGARCGINAVRGGIENPLEYCIEIYNP